MGEARAWRGRQGRHGAAKAMARRGEARLGWARQGGMARRGWARYGGRRGLAAGMARRGEVARRGKAGRRGRLGKARRGKAC